MSLLFQPLADVHAVPLDRLALIEASAGTGKTTTITRLYLRLLLEQGLGVDRILVVTYTKAATAELQDRIRRQLAALLDALKADGEDTGGDDFCRQFRDALAPDRRDLARRRLTMALSGFDQAAIHTIHGFCQRVLTESAFESGADFDCELLADDGDLLRAVVEDFWRREIYPESGPWVDFLVERRQTPDQWLWDIAPHVGKPFLRVVPAAVPEDRDRLAPEFRAAYARLKILWENGGAAKAERLLLEALNAKALDGRSYRKDRVQAWLGSLGAFLATAEPGLTLPASLDRLTSERLKDATKSGQTPPRHAVFDACRTLLDRHQAMMDGFEQRLVDLKIRLLDYCNAELPRRIRRQRQLSFSEMLNRLADALDGDSGESLARAIRARYPAALIDEFQDTDPVQYRIFRGVYGGREQPVFLVGDPKQAIYHFRGADVFSYLRAHHDAAARYTLNTNYRSVPPLIEAVNALFDQSHHPAPFLLDAIHYRQVEPAPNARGRLDIDGDDGAPFRFFLAPAGPVKKGEETPLNKGEANAFAADVTAREIARLLALAEAGKARIVGGNGPRALHGGDIAVLVPSHRQGGLVEQALLGHRIASVRHNSRDSVFETAEARELERVLWAIAEPASGPRVRAALLTECMGVSGHELATLLDDEAAFEHRVARFHRYQELWKQRGFMPMFRAWLEEENVADRLLAYADGERRLTNLRHLAERLQAESRGHGSLETLLGWYARALENPPREDEAGLLRLESDARRVKIVTIHTSKGLEFPVVFCPFLWDGKLWQGEEPAAFHDENRDGAPTLDLGSPEFGKHRVLAGRERLGEKLRQLYVALTRAEYRCYLVWGRIKEMETAALSWLLHGPETPGDDPVAALTAGFAHRTRASIEADLRVYAARAGEAVALVAPPEPVEFRPPPVVAENLAPAVFDRPPLFPSWRMTSFSRLATGRHSEAPDYDLLPDTEPVEAEGDSMFAFPRGAKAGSCLHAILEDWEFTHRDGKALAELVRRKLKAHGIEERWTDTARQGIEQLLAAPLDKHGLKLGDIPNSKRLVELEFTFGLGRVDAAGLQRILADPEHRCDPRFAEAAGRLDFRNVAGYMKGFIDLVFEANGRYYLADYKSNWLGNTYPDYAPERLAVAMAHDHYYLQYLIYTVALHRYLGQRLPDYRYDSHFGGVYYLFLRGIKPGRKTGIFWDRPRLSLVEALEQRLGKPQPPRSSTLF
jgi:exodeoxyribonuclease V beta subunit